MSMERAWRLFKTGGMMGWEPVVWGVFEGFLVADDWVTWGARESWCFSLGSRGFASSHDLALGFTLLVLDGLLM